MTPAWRRRDLPALPGGLGPPVASSRLGGGWEGSEIWRVTLADGREVVVKTTASGAAHEAEGLEALRTAGAAVPDVLGADGGVLVIEYVTGHGDPGSLGRRLARLHATTDDRFGWHRDNLIGPLPQANGRMDHWPTFVADQRLAPHLDVLPHELARRIRTAIDSGRLADLLGHGPAPSLVHGDLWSGNVIGWQWLIDPAVHHADREVDLAMLDLFGGLPEPLEAAYIEVAPLPDGARRRRLAYQLVPLLIHVRLFGAGYLPGIERRLDDLGW